MNKYLIATSLLSLLLLGCQKQPESTPATPAEIAAQLHVHYQVVSNFGHQCQFDGSCFDAELTLTLPFDSKATDWAIYFSNTKPIRYHNSELFDLVHLNGDLHKITPTAAFTGFNANQAYVIPFQGIAASVTKNDVMPNFIYVQDGQPPQIIAATVEQYDPATGLWSLPHAGEFERPEQWRRSDNDNVPLATSSWLYQQYASQMAEADDASNRVVPSLKQSQWQSQRVAIQQGLALQFSLPPVLQQAVQDAGLLLSDGGLTVIHNHQQMPAESYALDISTDQITIRSGDATGTYYAIQSLLQLYDAASQSLPLGQAQDEPRYGFRGVHVDVARNYHDKAFLLRLIKQMAALKFNKLHLHLAEDEAWRLQIPGLPELTEIGARRCFDLADEQCLLPQLGAGIDPNSQVNGYLTVEDYKDILQVAQQHHIEVIPSLDMPGHSRAAVQAMEARYQRLMQQEMPEQAMTYMLIDLADTTEYSSIQHYNDNTLNPCIDSTYNFIAKVLSEIDQMHNDAGVPLKRYHIGADETAGAWVESPACQQLMDEQGIAETQKLTAYFIARVTQMVNDMGVMAAAWSDGLSHVEPMKLGSRIQSNLWERLTHGGQHMAHQMTNYDWDTVLSLPDVLYFDFPYMPHPEESGYYWGSRYTSTFQVFQFMPDNLPAHAEFWLDGNGNPYTSDDALPLEGGRTVSGIQAQLWSETLRHESQAEYMLFPRLIAVAERAWHRPDWEIPYQPGQAYSQHTEFFDDAKQHQQLADWNGFVSAMVNNILPQLEANQVFYRLPPPGAIVEQGQLLTNVPWPNLDVEYTLDEGNSWQPVNGSVAVPANRKIGVRSLAQSTRRASQTMWLQTPAQTAAGSH
ncbi:carbohydate-binding domain-containing protein [Neiella sp. HB171785]|uniref:beta-N-acetylhexosaminidase n=1 Tax=Neiella litorisoli TaxID=2771431 RepID=A0A8J6QEM0_9GAMM|nr:carbohydate-binding domain-containing protein [Neiella litorisoli]